VIVQAFYIAAWGGLSSGYLRMILVRILLVLFLASVVVASGVSGAEPANKAIQPGDPSAQQELKSLNIAAFLAEMESFAKTYRKAKTTAQKQDIRAKAQARAAELIKGKALTLKGVVKDVRITGRGHAEIRYGNVDLGGFKQEKPPALQVTVSSEVVMKMSREQALAITPGSLMEFSGTATFHGGRNLVAQMFIPATLKVLRVPPSVSVEVRFANEIDRLCAVQIRDAQCRIAAAKPVPEQ